MSFTSTLPTCRKHFGCVFQFLFFTSSSQKRRERGWGGDRRRTSRDGVRKKHEVRKRKHGVASSRKFLLANNSSRLGYACHDAGTPAAAGPEVPAGGAEGVSVRHGERVEEDAKREEREGRVSRL